MGNKKENEKKYIYYRIYVYGLNIMFCKDKRRKILVLVL